MKSRTIPQSTFRILTDNSISMIDRVKAAEQGRSEGWFHYNSMLDLLKIPNTTYNRYVKVIRSHNKYIYDRVASGAMSVTAAVDYLQTPTYPLRSRLESINADIIFTDSRCAIYVYQGQCFFSTVFAKHGCGSSLKQDFSERLYLIDNKPYAVDTIKNLLKEGYTVSTNLRVCSPTKEKAGTLRHHIYAAYRKVDCSTIINEDVRFIKRPHINSVTDLRMSNICGPLDKAVPPISGWTAVMRRGEDIVITRKVDGLVTYTDYSPELYRVLNDYGALHTKADDNRLCLCVDAKHDIYLYHLRMIEHLYGLPHDKEGLITNIDRFRSEYLRQGMVVDHIDNDCTNDRQSNLILMQVGDNNTKKAVKQAVEKLGYPFFLWVERYDDTAIKMQAGYFSQFKRPCYMAEGVFTVPKFLEEAQNFVDRAREECTIFAEFQRLEKEEEKQE